MQKKLEILFALSVADRVGGQYQRADSMNYTNKVAELVFRIEWQLGQKCERREQPSAHSLQKEQCIECLAL